MGKIELKFKGRLPMDTSYQEVIKRLIEERKNYGLSQKEMATIVHITQSNYSKVEKRLYRLSFEQLKYLSKSKLDIFYISTGRRGNRKHIHYFEELEYNKLCYFLVFLNLVMLLRDVKKESEYKITTDSLYHMVWALSSVGNRNLFVEIRHRMGIQQIAMAERIGVDIKKYRDLEKNRCLPDSEIISKLYTIFNVSPSFVLNCKEIVLSEICCLLEGLEEQEIEVESIIKEMREIAL